MTFENNNNIEVVKKEEVEKEEKEEVKLEVIKKEEVKLEEVKKEEDKFITTNDTINILKDGKFIITKIAKLYKNNKLVSVTHLNEQNQIHRDDDKPAVTRYIDDKIICEEWYQTDMLHRDGDKPAVIEEFTDELGKSERWYQFGDLHRDGDLPAVIEIYNNGDVRKLEEWYQKGKSFRENGKPTKISYDINGNIIKFSPKNSSKEEELVIIMVKKLSDKDKSKVAEFIKIITE